MIGSGDRPVNDEPMPCERVRRVGSLSRVASTLQASCHCGAIRLEVARRPRTLTECNCSICRRYAARWAYYTRSSIQFHFSGDAVATYTYKTGTFLYYHCRRCGCVTHYQRIHTTNDDRFAINVRMMDPDEIATIPVRKLDVRKKRRRR